MPRLVSRLLALPLLVAVLVAIPTRLPAQPPDGGTRYALVIGVDQYEDAKRLPKLTYAEADAKALAQVLEAQQVKVTLLLGPAATKKAIEKAFDAILSKAGSKDTLLVAFAGHGQQFRPPGETEDVPFLCAADCTATRANTQVRLNTLLAQAGDAKVGKALFLIDACRTDPGARSGVTGNAVNVKAQTEVLFAAANGQKAREHADAGGKGNGHGLFMSEVIAALQGQAKNRRGEMTWNGLVAHITGEVTAKSKLLFPALEDSQHQTPHKLGSLVGEVVLFAEPKPGEEREFEIADGVKMTFCWIPPGEVTLGAPKAELDAVAKQLIDKKLNPGWLPTQAEGLPGKQKHVERKGFWLAKYPVTQKQWEAVMGTNPSDFSATGRAKDSVKGLDTGRFPVENVSFDDVYGKGWRDGDAPRAGSFLAKVNARPGIATAFGIGAKFRLPHANRWEYACRGGKLNKTAYYWGISLNGDKANCDGRWPFGTVKPGEYVGRPTPVGSYESKAPHPWGLCDMSGNVQQLCENLFAPNGKFHPVRGGAWSTPAANCRTVNHGRAQPSDRNNHLGFRICVILD